MSITVEESACTKPLRPEFTRTSRRLLESARSVLGWKERGHLDPRDEAVRRSILVQFPKLGRAPVRKEMMEALDLPEAELDASLRRLQALDLLYLDTGTNEILVAYPFSTKLTPHVISFFGSADTKPVFAQCAVDALGIPFMFGRAVSIASSCPFCTGPLSIEVGGGAIRNRHPADIAVWVPTCRTANAAASICPTLNFFCSRIHAAAWRQNHPDEAGEILTLGEALYLGQGIFGDLLKSPGGDRNRAQPSPTLRGPRNALGAASSVAGVVTAFFASVCCIGPLVVPALGAGAGAGGLLAGAAGFLKGLTPYRPWFIGVTVLMLGIAFFVTSRSPGGSCSADTTCAVPLQRCKQRIVLWIVSAIAAALVLAPYWAGL